MDQYAERRTRNEALQSLRVEEIEIVHWEGEESKNFRESVRNNGAVSKRVSESYVGVTSSLW